jgi:hypothetical protein
MKKNIFKLSALALTGAMALFSCGTKEEVTPTAGKPTAKVEFLGADFGKLQEDFKVTTTVSTTGDSAFIELSVKDGANATRAIYMMYQKDNEQAVKWTKQPNGGSIPSKGYVGSDYADATKKNNFNFQGSDYTFDVPTSINKSFKLVIPVALRTTGSPKSDVFTLWITADGKGRFDNPAKSLAYGVALITFNYTNEALINNYETYLGNAADTLGSLFSSKLGTNYKRSVANVEGIGTTIDFVYNTPGDRADNKFVFGSFYKTATTTDADVTAGFGDVTKITNVTKIVSATSGTFDAVVGDASLATKVDALITSSTTTAKVMYGGSPAGEEFVFVTASGKKGVVKIVSASGTGTTTAGQARILVKVQR